MQPFLPLLLMLAFLPLALFGNRIQSHLPRWVPYAFFIATGVFFAVSAVVQEPYRTQNLLFTFFSFLLLIVHGRRSSMVRADPRR